jgi:hypothetical protein
MKRIAERYVILEFSLSVFAESKCKVLGCDQNALPDPKIEAKIKVI